MASPADERLLDLLEKWLKSLELHARYATLDAAGYANAQAWPEHERPSRWIIELATQKTVALLGQVRERVAEGDTRFAESLELMAFLANLLGSQHIERFIPLAETPLTETPLAETPDARTSTGADAGATATRQMPRFVEPAPRTAPAAANPNVARGESRGVARGASLPPPVPAATAADYKVVHGGFAATVVDQVIADAARLVQWGRKWYELAELISGMADRPSLTDVRRILKDNKTVIDHKAGRG